MFSNPFDPFNDSGQLSIDQLRALADQAAAGTTVGSGHIIVHPGGMVLTPALADGWLYARITAVGTSGRHDWVESRFDTESLQWGDVAQGRSGTIADGTYAEGLGGASAAVDDIVQIFAVAGQAYWVFAPGGGHALATWTNYPAPTWVDLNTITVYVDNIRGMYLIGSEGAGIVTLGVTYADVNTAGTIRPASDPGRQRWRGTKWLYGPIDTDFSLDFGQNLILSDEQGAYVDPPRAGAGLKGNYQADYPNPGDQVWSFTMSACGTTVVSPFTSATMAMASYALNTTDNQGGIASLGIGAGIGMIADNNSLLCYFYVRDPSAVTHNGKSGTGGGGDTFTGGICTGLGGGTALTVGSSAITGGTSGGILWNNGGTLASTSGASTNDILYWNGSAWAPGSKLSGGTW